MSAKEKYAQAQEKVRLAREEARKVMSDALSQCALEVFRAHPEITGFKWRQFTPYFNDGDECVFSVDSDYPSLKLNVQHPFYSTQVEEALDSDEFLSGYELEFYKTPHHAWQETYRPAWEAVKDFVRGFDDDDMKSMFGDHIEVTVSFDGSSVSTSTEECNHD